MGFTTVSFVFFILPITVLLYLCTYKMKSVTHKNNVLILMSLVFYSWCGVQYLILLLGMVMVNYFGAVRLQVTKNKKRSLIVIVCADILVLAFFKYFNFFVSNIEAVLTWITGEEVAVSAPVIPLPLGISFFVFQMISFLGDVYSEKIGNVKFAEFLLYITLFPQLIEGPIIRYSEIEDSLKHRKINIDDIDEGIRRFIIGFAKKVLIADNLLVMSDTIFSRVETGIPLLYAWLGAVCYAFVIYFDFSGYSDMAIGLCRVFGFHILENFNYPYISKSIQEFWRRWHISLSSWFRDYVYIPLGGNREGKLKTYRNLIIVFLLTGIWHGASWTFIVWGIYHGAFNLLERVGLKKQLEKLPAVFSHVYCSVVVLVGWVFFRADTLCHALMYIKDMFWMQDISYKQLQILLLINGKFVTVFLAALVFSTPIAVWIRKKLQEKNLVWVETIGLIILFIVSVSAMMSSSFSPSIYTKF